MTVILQFSFTPLRTCCNDCHHILVPRHLSFISIQCLIVCSPYLSYTWCCSDCCHFLVPRHHSYISTQCPTISCSLFIFTSTPQCHFSLDVLVSFFWRYPLPYYIRQSSVCICCTHPSQHYFLFYIHVIWLFFNTHDLWYSFILASGHHRYSSESSKENPLQQPLIYYLFI